MIDSEIISNRCNHIWLWNRSLDGYTLQLQNGGRSCDIAQSCTSSDDMLAIQRCRWIVVSYHNHNRHHHWAAVVSRGWANASARRLEVSLSSAFLCQIVSVQYLSRSSLHRLAGLPCRLFLSYGLQVVTCEVHRSSLKVSLITLTNRAYSVNNIL